MIPGNIEAKIRIRLLERYGHFKNNKVFVITQTKGFPRDAFMRKGLEKVEKIETKYDWLNPSQKALNVPMSMEYLPNLKTIDFKYVPMINIDNIFKVEHLKELSLKGCCLKELPYNFAQLKMLQELDLSNNLLKEIPESIGEFNGLETLWLDNNKLMLLPFSFINLRKLTNFDISRNPLLIPPIEVAERGIKDVINYLDQIQKSGASEKMRNKTMLLGEKDSGGL